MLGIFPWLVFFKHYLNKLHLKIETGDVLKHYNKHIPIYPATGEK